MATHKSAEKRHRQNLKRRTKNRAVKATLQTQVKKTMELASKGDKAAAAEAAKVATRLFDKAVVHGVLHKNTASRKVSRLHCALNK